MADATMDALLKKRDELLKLASQLLAEEDVEKQKAISDQMAAMGREMEAMGEAMRVQARATKGAQGSIEIVLTPDQRKRVEQKHGVVLESVIIADEAGAMNQAMPMLRPEEIEIFAMKEAERRKAGAEAEKQMKAELEHSIAVLEGQDNAELQEQLDRLKQDPKFLGQYLKKK
jgi:hypothetical protein